MLQFIHKNYDKIQINDNITGLEFSKHSKQFQLQILRHNQSFDFLFATSSGGCVSSPWRWACHTSKFEVQSTGITHRMPSRVPPPQAGLRGAAVRASRWCNHFLVGDMFFFYWWHILFNGRHHNTSGLVIMIICSYSFLIPAIGWLIMGIILVAVLW